MPVIDLAYKPRPEQKVFHRSRAPIRFLRGGVGAGKTIAGAAEAVKLAIKNPGFDGMVVAPTWSILQRVTLREFLRLLPKQLIRSHHKQQRHILLVNGSHIFYGSADRPETLEGSNLAWAWGDEARYWRREAWNILIARARAPGAPALSIVLTSTPAMGWLFDEFGQDKDGAASWAMPTHTNPYLPAGFLDRLKRRYSPKLFKQYCEGAWVMLEGAVFEEFDLGVHLSEYSDLYVHGWPVHVGFDPGYRRSAGVYFQHFKHCRTHGVRDCIHVIGERLPDATPTTKAATLLRGDFSRNAWTQGILYVDPAGDAASIQVGYSDVDILESAGFEVEFTHDPESRHIPNGIEVIRSKLKAADDSVSLYIADHLQGEGHDRGIIKSLQTSAYPEEKEGKKIDDKPVKDGLIDHVRDAFRYGMVNLFPPVESRVVASH